MNKNYIANYLSTYNELKNWIEQKQVSSFDLADVKTKWIFIKLVQFGHQSKFLRKFFSPFIFLAERYPKYLRPLFLVRKRAYVQSKAIMARAYLHEYEWNKNEDSLNKAEAMLTWIKSKRNKSFQWHCWGQPYNWYIRKRIPANTPRTTVSTQVGNALLDAYEITGKEEYLKTAIDIGQFVIHGLNWKADKDGDICFSYTSADHYHIHNANMMAAAFILRVWQKNNDNNLKEFALKALRFTIKHQNPDGSWFYWAPPDKVLGKIDNYHTGYVLEALMVIEKLLKEDFPYHNELKIGLDFYHQHLFEQDTLAKMTHKSLYPIDMQSCAQAIITLSMASEYNPVFLQTARNVADWSILNMKDKRGFFYYRMYKNKKVDKTPYMRWSETWMMRALILLTLKTNKSASSNE